MRALSSGSGGRSVQTSTLGLRHVCPPIAAALHLLLWGCLLGLLLLPPAQARNPIRNAFLGVYPAAEGTQLDDLPSKTNHCGVCHFDFDGGGQRNPYGLGIEVGLAGGLSNAEAILAIAGVDSDNDGFSNHVEITEVNLFDNTPTFPGLSPTNYTGTLNIPHEEIEPYLTPSGGFDTTPPVVTVESPSGGEVLPAGTLFSIAYTATDESGIAHVDIYLSDDGGAAYKPVATDLEPSGEHTWFVPNRPGLLNYIRVAAVDNAGNEGTAESPGTFEITPTPAGYVPTTLRDMDMSGTQPLEGAVLEDPGVSCVTCHGNYNETHEPWFNWRGSMMGQAARDPLMLACMAVAEQDAPSVGDLCIRCHSPGGWQEGRSVDTSGDMLTAKDRQGVQCDFCHRVVDHHYVEGLSPLQDVAVLAEIEPLPLQYGNGQFINDPAPLMRGPYADANASHAFVESPIHRSSNLCGLCHDVSNPVFMVQEGDTYVPTIFDQEHPDMDIRNMFPIERTFSEWTQSEYAATGVYAPQFAGEKPDGIVSSCQDCHMRDVVGAGANHPDAPVRSDLGLHDFTGGNTFVPDIMEEFFPGEVDPLQLADAKARAREMLQLAATLEVTPEPFGVTVRVINETAHKLPSGYPEGRRIWLHIVAHDAAEQVVFESGAYDFATGVLTHDEQVKIYEIQPGLSPALASGIGLPAGKSFHFVLNDTIYSDNRIPPRGFTNAGFDAVQSPVVAHEYVDGQYWDETGYVLPVDAVSATATLYYQVTSKEYIEFLRDENVTNDLGQRLYDAWVAQGRAAPEIMAQVTTEVVIVPSAIEDPPPVRPLAYELRPAMPNPLRGSTTIRYTLPEKQILRIGVYDITGRAVCTLLAGAQPAGHHAVRWSGADGHGQPVASGVYLVRMEAGSFRAERKLLVLE